MKFVNIKNILILLTILSIVSINTIKFKHTRRNGFRVLMSKNYIDNISEYIMAFLKSSKIQQNVDSLTNCITDLIKTF